MTKTYWPFDTGAGAASYEDRWSEMARLWRQTGVLPDELNELEVYGDSSGMQVKTKSGKAWIRGHMFSSDAEEMLVISAAHATLHRIDRIILKLDWGADTITLIVLEGTAAASPTAPSLTQSASVWEISLAQVYVEAASTTVEAGDVTNERVYSYAEVDPNCGFDVVIGDGIGAVTTGWKGFFKVKYDMEITEITLISDAKVGAYVFLGGATGGTFTVSFDGQTTSALAYNANQATVLAAVEGLSTVGAGNATVVASTGGWDIHILVADSGTAVTGSVAGLTGATNPAVTNITGSIVIDLWKTASGIPTVANTITASAKPTLSSTRESTQTTFTGWTTTTLKKGDRIGVNVDSATTVKQVTMSVAGVRVQVA